jgi:hypothetical protein
MHVTDMAEMSPVLQPPARVGAGESGVATPGDHARTCPRTGGSERAG